MGDEPAEVESGIVESRNLAVEIIGTVVSMLLGAFLALLVDGNGLGFVSFIVLCSFIGWVVWARRKQPWMATLVICFGLLVVWWPIGLMIRDLGRRF